MRAVSHARVWIVALAIVCALSDASPLVAQLGALTPNAAEAEALQSLNDGMLVTARTQAAEIVRRDPDSIPGHYVLGRAMFDADGSLARAMFHLGRARELYETRGLAHDEFHQELLFQSARLAGQMELYEFQVELLGYHDHLYDPDLIAERCWPLMKLGRTDEARRFAEAAVGSPDAWQRSAGLNALCALEGETRNRQAAYEACTGALTAARESESNASDDEERGGIAVDAYNAALAAASALRFPEAEAFALEGVRRFEPTPANPWQFLVELYASEARMDDVLNAFASMLFWMERQPAALRDQGRAELEATVAIVMLLAGETEGAMLRIERALLRPDRRGLTTDSAEQTRGRHSLLRRIIRRTLAEEASEQASWEGRLAQLAHAVASLPEGLFGAYPDHERVASVLADRVRLRDTIRPYMAGGIDGLSPWLVGELIDVLSPAVVAVALEDARRADRDNPEATPFYDALEAEIAVVRGDVDHARGVGERALASTSEQSGWAMVRARLAARLAALLEDDGQRRRAYELYGLAMETDPSVIRRLGLSLPIAITGVGAGEEAADLLARSPRFRDEDGAFTMRIAPSPTGLRACLRSPQGNELRCVESQAPEADEEDAMPLPERLAYDVHRQVFGAHIDVSTVDLRSLDGHTNGGSALANERLRELMQQP